MHDVPVQIREYMLYMQVYMYIHINVLCKHTSTLVTIHVHVHVHVRADQTKLLQCHVYFCILAYTHC